jgi:hypothetical protein
VAGSLFVCATALTLASPAEGQQRRLGGSNQGRRFLSDSYTSVELEIRTGNDDLRGRNDNLDVELMFRDGTSQRMANVNHGQKWGKNSTHPVRLSLNQPAAVGQIMAVKLSVTGSDNWAMSGLSVKAMGATSSNVIATYGAKRFSRGARMLTVNCTELPRAQVPPTTTGPGTDPGTIGGVPDPMAGGGNTNTGSGMGGSGMGQGGSGQGGAGMGQGGTGQGDTGMGQGGTGNTTTPPAPAPVLVNQLHLVFRTAGDDLRGGNDNLSVEVLFRDGTSKFVNNVNDSQNWPNYSQRDVTIFLDRSVRAEEIQSVRLSTNFTGGGGGDNWNMERVDVQVVGSDRRGTNSFKRFTGDDRELVVPLAGSSVSNARARKAR